MIKSIKKIILFPVWVILSIIMSLDDNVKIDSLDKWAETATLIDIFYSLFIGICILSVILTLSGYFLGIIHA